jgi:aminoglycoside phosphotransferase (APT) family kinase protein
MYRLDLSGQPTDVPARVVLRIAPHETMGAKEVAVQRSVAGQGFATPRIHLHGPADHGLDGAWSIMDFVPGRSPLGGLDGLGALRQAPTLLRELPRLLAAAMAALHDLDPEPTTAAVREMAPTVSWNVGALLEHFAAAADALARPDLRAAVEALAATQPPEERTVICHGDLHPFNLLVDATRTTVIDWTGALRADPAYDVAFTALLLANPPLDGPRLLSAAIAPLGRVLARRFTSEYQRLAPGTDLHTLAWYQGLHGARLLIEVAARRPTEPTHPFSSLHEVARAAITTATQTEVGPAR